MSAFWGNLMVLSVLALVVALAVHSLWQSRKQSGGCNGHCASCGRCHGQVKKEQTL